MELLRPEEVTQIASEYPEHDPTGRDLLVAKTVHRFSITRQDFDRLIWQEIDATRFLTPRDQPRTMADIRSRLAADGRSFQQLAEGLRIPGEYDPEWFKGCVRIIEQQLQLPKGRLVLVRATPAERDQSPNTRYYIRDGVHRALVVASEDPEPWPRVEALLIHPRP